MIAIYTSDEIYLKIIFTEVLMDLINTTPISDSPFLPRLPSLQVDEEAGCGQRMSVNVTHMSLP